MYFLHKLLTKHTGISNQGNQNRDTCIIREIILEANVLLGFLII